MDVSGHALDANALVLEAGAVTVPSMVPAAGCSARGHLE
jgi:hypothetical protein